MRELVTTWRRRAPAALVICLLAGSATARADDPCTKTFVPGSTAGNITWHNDAHWDPEGVPGPNDVACILADGLYQVVVSLPVTVAGLRLDVENGQAKLLLQSGDFTLNGLGYLAGDTKLKVNDGSILGSDGGGVLEVHSTLIIEGGTVAADVDLWGHLNWTCPGSITGGLTSHPGSRIEVEGPVGEAHLTVAGGFEVHGSLVFNDAVTQSLTVVAGALVVAAEGTVSTRAGVGSATSVPELRADLDNSGTLRVDGLGLRLTHSGAQHANRASGVIEVSYAELEIDLGSAAEVPSNFTNYGTTTVGGGGSVRVIGSAGVLEVPSNFTNHGTTTVGGGGTVRVIGGVGRDSTLMFLNTGDLGLDAGGTLAVIDADFTDSTTGRVGGNGVLDLSRAAAVVFHGSLEPGWSPGILTVEGALDLGGEARVALEVGGESAGESFDRLDVTGTLAADGVLEVSLLGGYHPSGGERYRVLTFGALEDWFGSVELPALANLLAWSIELGATDLVLKVECDGTQLGSAAAADRDPVSVGHELLYQVVVTNHSNVGATELALSDPLPPSLVFRPDLSSPECVLVGGTVECTKPSLAPSASWELVIGAEAVVVGRVANTVTVGSWECETLAADNSATATVEVVAAAPCDANYDLSVDSGDLESAAGHIFGVTAPGNPDCRPGDGITADDLAAIVEQSH